MTAKSALLLSSQRRGTAHEMYGDYPQVTWAVTWVGGPSTLGREVTPLVTTLRGRRNRRARDLHDAVGGAFVATSVLFNVVFCTIMVAGTLAVHWRWASLSRISWSRALPPTVKSP